MPPVHTFFKERKTVFILYILLLGLLVPKLSFARLTAVSDDELDQIEAQALLDFEVQSRHIKTTDRSWPWPDGYVDYDALVLKADTEITVSDLYLDRGKLGYYDDGRRTGWDLDLDGDFGIIVGADGHPIVANGLRIEIAVDDINAANPNLMFVRIGTDDLNGRIRTGDDGLVTLDGSVQTLSMDGHIRSILGARADLNDHRMTMATAWVGILPIPLDLGGVKYMDFGTTGNAPGPTDLYISFANLIEDSVGSDNDGQAFNPGESGATTIPGRGAWLHFQQLFTQALLELKK